MRRFSANYVYTNNGAPIRNGIVEVDDNGTITAIINQGDNTHELSSTEFYNGVIVPGFINCHCHTELSGLNNKIEKNLGLAGFISTVRESRNLISSKTDRISDAVKELEKQGCVAVVDICNTSISFEVKNHSSIQFINLIEIFGVEPNKAKSIIDNSLLLKNSPQIKKNDLAFISPHSTYSLSINLWELVSQNIDETSIVSIHFAESKQEQEFTMNRSGEIAKIYSKWGVQFNSIPSGEPVDIAIKYLPKKSKILFVHNTFTEKQVIDTIANHFINASFVICPESNLFIENTLPNMSLLKESNVNIAIGTDSLASSDSLSMLKQIQIISEIFPRIPFADSIKWATIGGAKALGIDEKFGSIKVGKTPGLNLITPFNFSEMLPNTNSKIKKLI